MESIRIRPWSGADLPLLLVANAPEMTAHLGGPETDGQVRSRHENYLRFWEDGTARMFAITADGEAVGGIGWWTTQWHGADIHETGWFVVPEAQGRGIARLAVEQIVEDARLHRTRDVLAAFPARSNGPSNALCERCGFALSGVESLTFRGRELTVNAWILDLEAGSPEGDDR